MANRDNRPGGLESPATKIVAVSSGVAFTDGACRALLVGTAGNADLIDAEGNSVATVPLQQGYNPIRVTKVTFSASSPAANVWALY